jgi:hypothetical protein
MSIPPRERRGPLLARSARRGAELLLVAVLQFLIVGLLLPLLRSPGFPPVVNGWSYFPTTSPGPWGVLFLLSLLVFGLLNIAGFALLWSAFRPGGRRFVALGLTGVGSWMAALVGAAGLLRLESLNSAVVFGTVVAFGVGLLLLPLAMTRDTRWDGARIYTALSGLIVLVALALQSRGVVGLLGSGALPWLELAPILLWEIVVVVRLLRLPTYAPSRPVREA